MFHQHALQMRQVLEDVDVCSVLHTGKKCRDTQAISGVRQKPLGTETSFLLAVSVGLCGNTQNGELMQLSWWPCGHTNEMTLASKVVCLVLSTSPATHTVNLPFPSR